MRALHRWPISCAAVVGWDSLRWIEAQTDRQSLLLHHRSGVEREHPVPFTFSHKHRVVGISILGARFVYANEETNYGYRAHGSELLKRIFQVAWVEYAHRPFSRLR